MAFVVMCLVSLLATPGCSASLEDGGPYAPTRLLLVHQRGDEGSRATRDPGFKPHKTKDARDRHIAERPGHGAR